MIRWFVLAVAAVPLLLTTWRMPAPALVWWVTHSLDKVHPYDGVPAKPIKSISISAARNEFEAFQIVLRTEADTIDEADIEITDLRGSGGAVFSKSNTTIYLQRYIDLKLPSNSEGRPGDWPDPLIPKVDRYAREKRNGFPFRLNPGRNQPFWIDVYVPPSTSAGVFRGDVQVSIAGKDTIHIPIQLRVWDFELPSTSSFITSFGFNGTSAVRQHFGKYTSDTDLYEITFLYRKAALWHRISLHGGSMVPPALRVIDGRVEVDWEKYDQEAGPFLDGTVFASDEPLRGAKATSVEVRTRAGLDDDVKVQYWRHFVQHLNKKGWMDRLFNYLWDEPKSSDYAAMIRLGRLARLANPQLQNLVTAPLHAGWSAIIDVWAPLINCFERKPSYPDFCVSTVERSLYVSELQKGKKLWWYQSCASHGCDIVGGAYFRGWPSYMIDATGVANRVMPWLAWKYEIQGELYFNINEAYAKKQNPWNDVYLFGGNGDGTLVYPGRPDIVGGRTHIPIESMRLKLIREGLEDYEYLMMLSKRAGRQVVAEIVDSWIRKTYDFDQDPEKLYAARERMGRELEKF